MFAVCAGVIALAVLTHYGDHLLMIAVQVQNQPQSLPSVSSTFPRTITLTFYHQWIGVSGVVKMLEMQQLEFTVFIADFTQCH